MSEEKSNWEKFLRQEFDRIKDFIHKTVSQLFEDLWLETYWIENGKERRIHTRNLLHDDAPRVYNEAKNQEDVHFRINIGQNSIEKIMTLFDVNTDISINQRTTLKTMKQLVWPKLKTIIQSYIPRQVVSDDDMIDITPEDLLEDLESVFDNLTGASLNDEIYDLIMMHTTEDNRSLSHNFVKDLLNLLDKRDKEKEANRS